MPKDVQLPFGPEIAAAIPGKAAKFSLPCRRPQFSTDFPQLFHLVANPIRLAFVGVGYAP